MATSCSREGANQQAPGAESGGGANARGGRGGGRGAGGAPVPVVTGHSVAKPMPVTIPAVGTAEPLVTVQVRAQVTGQLSRVHFREGQDVNKGDTAFHAGCAAVRGGAPAGGGRSRPGHGAGEERPGTADAIRGSLQPRPDSARPVRNAGGHSLGARGDARRRSVAGRERPSEPSVHDDHGADLRPDRAPWPCTRATWFAPTTRRRWSSSTRSRRSTCRSRCRAGICREIRRYQAQQPLRIEAVNQAG